MRESLNYNLIPIPQNNMMNEIEFNTVTRSVTNISSNGYYGYQPQIYTQQKDSSQTIENIEMDNEICDMNVQFNNSTRSEEMLIENSPLRHRKRRWEFGDELDEPKKRRQNDKSFNHQAQHLPSQKSPHLRKPTHNIPDLPRCIMENNDNGMNPTKTPKEDEEEDILEDILRETHGVCGYHWFSNDV